MSLTSLYVYKAAPTLDISHNGWLVGEFLSLELGKDLPPSMGFVANDPFLW
jgi:hypothetical protein